MDLKYIDNTKIKYNKDTQAFLHNALKVPSIKDVIVKINSGDENDINKPEKRFMNKKII